MTGIFGELWVRAGALFLVGGVAGTLNVIAGGGSFLTLPVMIFLGLPPTVANGTNRVAILVQNLGATGAFQRHRIIEWGLFARVVAPALVGAGLGTWAALAIGDEAFRRALAVLMVVVALWTLWDPFGTSRGTIGSPDEERGPGRRLGTAGLAIAFFLVGLYGGFVQAGVGFLILAATTLAGLDLVRGNALKVLVILSFTPLALALFALGGKVEWGLGTALATGNLLGGFLGVHLTVLKGHAWVKRVVTGAVVVFAVLLWVRG